MTDLRGHVPISIYASAQKRIEQLEDQLQWAHYLLGDAAGDDARCAIVARRTGMRRGDIKFLLRLTRMYPRIAFSDLKVDHVYVCRIRAEMRKSNIAPRQLQTVNGVGYGFTAAGQAWAESWAPELFRPIAEVMGDYARTADPKARALRGEQRVIA